MADSKIRLLDYGRYTMEMRSGKILTIDEGFTKLMGYTDDDIKDGKLVYKQLVPNVDYDAIINDMRQNFIDNVYTCYQHDMVSKDGSKTFEVVSFVNIRNKLLEGHRVLEVGFGVIG